MPPSISIITTLNDVLSPEAESLLQLLVKRRWVNGVAVGIWRNREGFARVIGDGVTLDSRFELGSLTKIYTAELLAAMVEAGQVHLSDPIVKFLPYAMRSSFTASSITLLDLATHCSGLPRLPPGVDLFSRNPYAKYSAASLEKDVATLDLARPTQPKFLYSNYGYSLLGHALSRVAGVEFPELLEREVLAKAGLRETSLAMEGRRQPRVLDGYRHSGWRTSHWTFDVCTPCGGLCSTVSDQLKWLAWLLQDPDRTSLQARAAAGRGSVGLGWMVRPGGESAWHNGATFGFSSYLGLNRRDKSGVVILSNRSNPALVTAVGSWFEAALAGRPMGVLKGDYGIMRARLLEPVQMVASPMVGPFLRPIMSLPLWARVPLAGGMAYGVDWLVQLMRHL